MADPALADTLRAALIKSLSGMAIGEGGSADVFSAQLAKQLAAAEAALLAGGP